MPASLRSQLGEVLRSVRLERGLTQEQLAEQLGMTPRYLAAIERGERNLGLDTVDALAEHLSIRLELSAADDR